MSTSGDLGSLLGGGNVAKVVAFFAGMAEADRRKHAPQALEILRAFRTEDMFDGNVACARVAAVASASPSELKKLGWRMVYLKDEDAYEVLRDRRPKPFSGYLEWLLERGEWRLVRRIVRERLSEPPDSPLYTLGMIFGVHEVDTTIAQSLLSDPELLDDPLWKLFEHEGGGEVSLAAHDKYRGDWSGALVELAAQGHLDRNRLLRASLEALSRDFGQFRAGWFSRFHDALEPTNAERAELAAAYLALLSSPIPPTVSMALRHLEELWGERRLAPDDLVPQLEPVLFAKSKSTALQALELLTAAAERAPALGLVVAKMVARALEHPSAEVQARAFAHLRTRQPEHAEALRTSVCAQLDHVAPSLRAELAAWLGANEDDSRAELSAASVDVVTTIDLQVPVWARTCAGLDATSEDLWGEALPTGLVPRLVGREVLHVPDSVEGAIELLESAAATPGNIDLVERAIAGVAGNPLERSDPGLARRIGPLRKQLARLDARQSWHTILGEPTGALLMLAEAWLDGRMPDGFDLTEADPVFRYESDQREGTLEQRFSAHGVSAVFLQRTLDLCVHVARGEAVALLSTPSHAGGWLAPAALCSRLQAKRPLGSDADRVLALLRLAPDGRTTTLEAAQHVPDELGAALRYALGAQQEPLPQSAALWIAAARARAPHANDAVLAQRYSDLGPGGAQAARLDFAFSRLTHEKFVWHVLEIVCEPKSQVPQLKSSGIHLQPRTPYPFAPWHLMPSVLCYHLHQTRLGFCPEGAMSSAWSASLWPQNVEPLLVHAALESCTYLRDKRPAMRPRPAGFDALFDPDVPVPLMGQLLIALALTASEEGDGQLAVDACIDAGTSARLDPRALGRTMHRLYFEGPVSPSRWAKRLRVASRHSSLMTLFVRDTLCALLVGEGELRKDTHALLELLRDCCIESGSAVSSEGTRNLLACVEGSSAMAKAARAALALERDEAKAARVERQVRVELRVARQRAALRWAEGSL